MKNLLNILLLLVMCTSCIDKEDENTWTVGISADNPPYTFVENGEFKGFEIDIINEIGKISGKKIALQNMAFHTLIASLNTGKVDMVIAGMSVTEARLKKVDFSKAYTETHNAFLHKKGRVIDDFSHKKIGVLLASTYNLVADDISKKCDCEVISLTNTLILVEALKNDRVDVVILERAQAEKFVKQHPNLDYFVSEDYSNVLAIVLTKNSPIKTTIDEAIDTLHENKIIDKLSNIWGLNDTNK